MATYASYRHIELDNIGSGKKKVLKPPGGGSSDIFGTASTDEVNPHKRGTNQKNLQSSIILGGQIQKQTNGSDATNGNSDKPVNPAIIVEPQIIVKTNIQGNTSSETLNKVSNIESATAISEISYHNSRQSKKYFKKKDGNPVTGEGYEPTKPTVTPAQHVSVQSEPAPEQKKASRVPPGGYSSGLW